MSPAEADVLRYTTVDLSMLASECVVSMTNTPNPLYEEVYISQFHVYKDPNQRPILDSDSTYTITNKGDVTRFSCVVTQIFFRRPGSVPNNSKQPLLYRTV